MVSFVISRIPARFHLPIMESGAQLHGEVLIAILDSDTSFDGSFPAILRT